MYTCMHHCAAHKSTFSLFGRGLLSRVGRMVDDKGRDLVPGLYHPTIATSLAGDTNESLAGIDVLG